MDRVSSSDHHQPSPHHEEDISDGSSSRMVDAAARALERVRELAAEADEETNACSPSINSTNDDKKDDEAARKSAIRTDNNSNNNNGQNFKNEDGSTINSCEKNEPTGNKICGSNLVALQQQAERQVSDTDKGEGGCSSCDGESSASENGLPRAKKNLVTHQCTAQDRPADDDDVEETVVGNCSSSSQLLEAPAVDEEDKPPKDDASSDDEGALFWPQLVRRAWSSREEEEPELAHQLEPHTFTTPTTCDICGGLLVGLWSQGLQCQRCHLNVHRGEGRGEHDDCRAEALLAAPCPGVVAVVRRNREDRPEQPRQQQEEEAAPIAVALQAVRDLAAESPSFWSELRDQLDRDLASHARDVIISKGVEDERHKNLRRVREQMVPFLERLDAWESKGDGHVLVFLLWYQAVASALVVACSMTGFLLALWPGRGFASIEARHLALSHSATVICTFHVFVFLFVLLLRYGCGVLNRKRVIIDTMFRDIFALNCEEDVGLSVEEGARRLRLWIAKLTLSSALSFCVAVIFWRAALFLSQGPVLKCE